MPQLAPVNWLFLFSLFWFIIAVTATLIWWSFKTDYMLPQSPQLASSPIHTSSNTWPWH
uniref:ATP synthase F0 subunit 8 n=1 Tax=Monodonta labio TaxID=74046 RepID=UPI001FF27258|nr:ATP synthase F0 subunit 8 [Monodonta labio]UOH96729.1 ATP synthase F0 subunit 8 [Monodonta labio]